MRAALPALFATALASGAAGAECGRAEGFARVVGERVVLLFRPEPAPIAVGRALELELRVCTAGGEPFDGTVEVDAVMPAHGHGMNYRPEAERTGPGRYRVRGVLLHMPGRWQIRFVLRDADGSERLAVARELG